MCGTYRWLAWLCKAPIIVIDIVQGVVPPMILAILLKLVLIILRSLARWEGIPHRTGVELTLMDRFFMFQVIVSAFCIDSAQFSYKDAPEWLSGRNTFFWYYRIFTRLSKSPVGSPDTPCSKPTEIFHFLPNVSAVSDSSSSSLPYFNTQICNASRSFWNR